MKKRVFYVVNLDRSRIYVLAGGAALCMLVVFSIGMRVGRSSVSGDAGDAERPLALIEPDAIDPPADAPTNTSESPDASLALSETDLDARLRAEAAALNAGRNEEPDDRSSAPRQERVYSERAREPQRAESTRRDEDARVTSLANVAERDVNPEPESRRAADRRAAEQRAAEREAADSRAARETRAAERRATERRAASERRAAERRTAERRAAERRAAERRSTERRASEQRAAEPRTAERPNAAPPTERTAQSQNKTQQFRTLPASRETGNASADAGSALLTVEGGAVSRETPPASRTPTPAARTEPQKTQESRRTHSLQLGAFRSRAAADRMAESLRSQGFRPYIQSAGDSHVVRVGRAASSQELSPVEDRLRSHNYAPMRVAD